MKENKFIWADLSSYQPLKIKSFYENVFNWKYYKAEGYYIAYKNSKEVVGLYQTPKKFQKMKMPSFWMSYIQVNDVKKAVEKALLLGGIIELVDTDNELGGIALIRDTLGAGFTIYDGNQLDSKTTSEENMLIFNELHVSDAREVINFYENLFDWNIVAKRKNSFDIFCKGSKAKVAAIHQIDNAIKSKYEYWVCTFGVQNLSKTIKRIKENNGNVIYDEGNRVLCSDGSEAFFYVQQLK